MDNRFNDVSNEDVKKEIDKIDLEIPQSVYRRMFSFIDLTSLNTSDSNTSIKEFVTKVNNFGFTFPDLPQVAALCVFPKFIPVLRELLSVDTINIASVAGSFPTSQTFLENKLDEIKRVINKGADEIDIVLSIGEFLDGNYDQVSKEIRTIKDTVGCVTVKVILETGILEQPELIYKASSLAIEAGADFIKTSTGKAPVSATPEAAFVMCSAISDHYNATKKATGFKAAGGIGTAEEAKQYYSIVESVLSREWLVPDRFRIGASRLANNLLRYIEGRTISYF